MTAGRFRRRGDDQLVEAMTYTGHNAAEVRAWLVGYRVAETDGSLVVTGHTAGFLEVQLGDWLARDDERVEVVRAYEFFSRYRRQPVE